MDKARRLLKKPSGRATFITGRISLMRWKKPFFSTIIFSVAYKKVDYSQFPGEKIPLKYDNERLDERRQM